ncbi:hypothetical protein P7K49_037463 [Saguinus oedipus]|uniref:Uncharacterized protein n=1 Tax=Saguinus oedipus TaxID=9490 RepID=A0ABQ9TIQ4_SAGOE|nr:hypothetical protein P7K49_037463 [Saguinus oedipus]
MSQGPPTGESSEPEAKVLHTKRLYRAAAEESGGTAKGGASPAGGTRCWGGCNFGGGARSRSNSGWN